MLKTVLLSLSLVAVAGTAHAAGCKVNIGVDNRSNDRAVCLHLKSKTRANPRRVSMNRLMPRLPEPKTMSKANASPTTQPIIQNVRNAAVNQLRLAVMMMLSSLSFPVTVLRPAVGSNWLINYSKERKSPAKGRGDWVTRRPSSESLS